MAKTSLSLPDESMPLAREHAAHAGLTVSAWVARAIRNAAADEEVDAYGMWRDTWSAEERAAQDAFDAAAWEQ